LHIHSRLIKPDLRFLNSCIVIFYSGWELREQLQWRHSLDAGMTLPQKGGLKDYAPDGSWLQERKLENFYSERLSILREERVHTKYVFVYWTALHCRSDFCY